MPSAATRRSYTGPAIFSFGFRPFFLGVAVWSVLAVPLWLLVHLGGGAGALSIDRDWHVHEMLFGYVAGTIAGFLLTAIPNWTGRLPVAGRPLAGLFALWVAGRLAMLVAAGHPIAAGIDATFLVTFAGVVWREILTGRNWRNLPVAVLVTLLALANVAFQARLALPVLGPLAERAAIGMIALLIAFIGGRVVPSFTRNWMMQQRLSPLPASEGLLDRVSIAAVAGSVSLWVALGDRPMTGAFLCLGGLAIFARLSRWRTGRTLGDPLVWSLHAGYAWLGLGLLMLGAHGLYPNFVPRTAGFHGLMVGAAGAMTLSMMTRATLGHTGREWHADGWTLVSYLAVSAGAVLRVTAAFAGPGQGALLASATAAWVIAFGAFVVRYGPMLVRPRLSS